MFRRRAVRKDYVIEIAGEQSEKAQAPTFTVTINHPMIYDNLYLTASDKAPTKGWFTFVRADENKIKISITPKTQLPEKKPDPKEELIEKKPDQKEQLPEKKLDEEVFNKSDELLRGACGMLTKHQFTTKECDEVIKAYEQYLANHKIVSKFTAKKTDLTSFTRPHGVH